MKGAINLHKNGTRAQVHDQQVQGREDEKGRAGSMPSTGISNINCLFMQLVSSVLIITMF